MSADAVTAPEATHPDDIPAPPVNVSAALAVPVQQASIRDKLAYAGHLAKSGLLPAAFRGRPENVLYTVEYGAMLGLSPMAAITGIHVIEGKPTASSALMSALVRRAGHRLRITGNDERALVQIIRSDDPGFTFESVWTLDRARRAELTGKKVWKQYPAAMLKARAISECARDACEEALLGMHYTAEELGLDVDDEGRPVVDGEIVPDGPGATVTPHPVTKEPVWAEEVPAAEERLDRARLTELWHMAKHFRPSDSDLLAVIVEAGKRVKAAIVERDQPAPPSADTDPVDAEIVPDPADFTARLVVADSLAAVQHIVADLDVTTAAVDIAEHLPPDVVDVLGLDLDENGRGVTLAVLADRVATYTSKHHRAASAALG